MQEQEDKRQQEMAKQAAEEKKLELAPDKEKLSRFVSALLAAESSVKSVEARNAIAHAVNILTEAANKM